MACLCELICVIIAFLLVAKIDVYTVYSVDHEIDWVPVWQIWSEMSFGSFLWSLIATSVSKSQRAFCQLDIFIQTLFYVSLYSFLVSPLITSI